MAQEGKHGGGGGDHSQALSTRRAQSRMLRKCFKTKTTPELEGESKALHADTDTKYRTTLGWETQLKHTPE